MDIERLVIDGGITGNAWATYELKPNGSLLRVKSIYLPMRPTRAEARRDLLAWLDVIKLNRRTGAEKRGQAGRALARLEAE